MAIDPRVEIGHVHLKVADIDRALEFWSGVLGFELQQRMGDQAAFVSAGGYHHHLGLNTWHSSGAPPHPAGSLGLRHFTVRLPGQSELERVADQVRAANMAVEQVGDGWQTRDPSGNALLMRA